METPKIESQKTDKKKITWIASLIVVALIAIAGIVVAYQQYDQRQEFIAQATEEKLAREQAMMESYARIEGNLAKISQHESMIQQNMVDAESTSTLAPEERIQNEINMIEQLINENNLLIDNLNSQIDEKDSRLASYEKTTRDLKARIAEYKDMVDALVADKEALQRSLDETTLAKNNLEIAVDNMGNEIAQKRTVIEDQNQLLLEKELKLNTAYYTVGTYKELRDQNIVEKEGGFLGINREKTLAGRPAREKFQEIDIREVTEIPVDAKRCEIITGQDPSCYSLQYENGLVTTLKITDPQKFWEKSKYLVVVVRDTNSDEMALSR